MSIRYLTDEEYESYWVDLGGMRTNVSRDLGLATEMKVLDVGTGWGFFAIEMAKRLRKGKIVGIDIVPKGLGRAKELIRKNEIANIVEIVRMDAANLSFMKNSFDFSTSFLGMRDIYMTRGKEGVKEATKEMVRVTKPGGRIILCITPPEDAETEDQKLAIEVEGEVFGAKSLPKKFYADVFRDNGVLLKTVKEYSSNKKLTAKQTKVELTDGIEIARKIYGKIIPEFKDVWNRYQKRIESFGYGMYSKIVMLVGEKAI
jgi:ubiquinone/menaquinone biosynthesis C-methylase UbiE